MTNKSDKSLYYGWEHIWQNPRYTECVKDYIRSPFGKPKIVRPFPFLSNSEKEFKTKPLNLAQGIPDCWAEVVAHNIILGNKSTSKYDSMQKEDVDVARSLRKDYRLYIGQGIPDPWTNYPVTDGLNPPQFEGLKKEIKKYIFHLLYGKNKGEPCLCCEKKLLFKCPDEIESCVENINTKNKVKCSCRDCHRNESKLNLENCKFAKILQNWALHNINSLKDSIRHKEKNCNLECVRPSQKNILTKKEEKPYTTFCYNAEIVDSNDESNRREFVSENKSLKDSPNRPKFCSCTYIPKFKRTNVREKSTITDFNVYNASSKSVQTDPIQIIKSDPSYYESRKLKSKKKCSCDADCYGCGLYKCKIVDSNFGRQTVNSKTNFSNNQVECTCSYGKSFDKGMGDYRKKGKSIVKKKEVDEESDNNDGGYPNRFGQNSEKKKEVFYYYPIPAGFNHLNYITNNKLKYNFYEKEISLKSLHDRLYQRESFNAETSSSDKISKPFYYKLSSNNKNSESSCEDKFLSPRKETTKLDVGVQTNVEAEETQTNVKFNRDSLDTEDSRANGLAQNSETNTNRKRRKLANKRRRMNYRKSILNKEIVSSSKKSFNEDSIDCLEESPPKNCCYIMENDSGVIQTLNFCDGLCLEEYSKELEKRGLKLNLNKVYVSKPEFDVLKKISQQTGTPWSTNTLKGIVDNFIDEGQVNLKKRNQTTETKY